MLAAIDAGSNTLRLLVGRVGDGKVYPELYLRRICRLAGGFSPQGGLAADARERTLAAMQEFAVACRNAEVRKVKAVGTAAFRHAVNGIDFAQEIRTATQLPFEIITGDMEASYMAAGVLSALEPMPVHALIIDIGGGSTEFVLSVQQKIVWSCSLPLGVVRLTEDYPSVSQRLPVIEKILTALSAEVVNACKSAGIDTSTLVLVGTAGTATTLAALDLQMEDYDWRRVNNYTMPLSRLRDLYSKISTLSLVEREALPGMEVGRGDLIVSGLEIVCCLMRKMKSDRLTISDFGLLEGLLLAP